ncbi:hypothetical protein PRUPE_6G176800 [Prunus persica]|uniref:Uncharacterized protein n=1 Tax=Prunus persica TaxID=3760 RepID=A0A251NRY3_PRUPE|nr:hypothetical protein PRUPE_6G176800 [Prunus persica]
MWTSLPGHDGSRWHQPVILPLQRAGGRRCSVNPASRGALLFRSHVAQSFRSDHMEQLFAWNGQASKEPYQTQPVNSGPKFHHLNAPT